MTEYPKEAHEWADKCVALEYKILTLLNEENDARMGILVLTSLIAYMASIQEDPEKCIQSAFAMIENRFKKIKTEFGDL